MCPAVSADGHHPNGHRGRGPVRSKASGELTAVVPFELVDAVLAETRTVQQRLRDLPSRAGVYFLLAMCLFPDIRYCLVWDKPTAGLSGMPPGLFVGEDIA